MPENMQFFGGTLRTSSLKFFVCIFLAAGASLFAQNQTPSSSQAQTTSSPQNQVQLDSPKGITGFESIQGTINSDSRVYKLDSNLGWDFNKHFGVFAGVPVYFASVPSSTTTTGTTTTASTTNSGIGNVYLGFILRAPNPKLDYASAVTASAPTGSVSKGFSTGRASVD
ncbi:MAG TPA: hypothetical protein VJW55_04835, partial [Candidatus Angelobacter sp.]|nr:hypothetical protein [Candidatus Angelobacter sp.]